MRRESRLLPAEALFRQSIPAGDYWIDSVKKNQVLRIVDVEGNQAADTLLYNADDISERYSAVDTIREQRNVYLSCGSKLLSTSGNVLAQIVADTVGRHDTLGGACAAESNTVRYAQEVRTMHSCRDSSACRGPARSSGYCQARPHAQHQFFHERSGDCRGRSDIR